MAGHPRDWARGIPGVTMPAGASAAPVAVGEREPSAAEIERRAAAEEAADRARHAREDRERERQRALDRREAEDARQAKLRELRDQAEEVELQRRIAGDTGNGHGPKQQESETVATLRGIVDKLMDKAEDLQDRYQAQLGETQKAQLAALEARLLALQPATSADRAHPLQELANTIEEVVQVRDRLTSLVPIVPQAGAAPEGLIQMSPRERLEMTKITEESTLRRMDLEDKIQDRKDARAIRARELDLRDKQLDGLFEGLKELGPLFGALFAGKVPDAFTNPNSRGPEAATADAAGIAWTCPGKMPDGSTCNSHNLAPLGAASAVCPRCHQLVLFSENMPPPEGGVPPGFQGAPAPEGPEPTTGTPPPAGWQEV